MEEEPPIVSERKELLCVLAAVYEEWVASELTMLPVQESTDTWSNSMMIDSGSTHNLMSCKFASKLGFHVTKTKPCKLFILNGESNPVDLDCWTSLSYCKKRKAFDILKYGHEVNTTSYWLNDVDA